MKKIPGKIKVICTKCRQPNWVRADIVKAKIKKIRAKTHRPNAGYRCTHCI